MLVQTLVDKGPAIFLKLAQISNGEIDAYMSPINARYVNFTALQSAIKFKNQKDQEKDQFKFKETEYLISPRKLFEGRIVQVHSQFDQQSYDLAMKKYVTVPNSNLQRVMDLQSIQQKIQDDEDQVLMSSDILKQMRLDRYKSFNGNIQKTYKGADKTHMSSFKSVFDEVKRVKVMLIDTILEEKARIGKTYPFKGQRLPMGSCIIHYSGFDNLESAIDSIIWVRIGSVRQLLSDLLTKFNLLFPDSGIDQEWLQWYHYIYLTIPCQVVGVMDSAHGKYPNAERDPFEQLTNQDATSTVMTVILEYSSFLKLVSDYLPWMFQTDDFKDYIGGCQSEEEDCKSVLYDYSDYVALNMPNPREDRYSSNDFDSTQRVVTSHVNKFILDTKSIRVLQASMPLLEDLETYSTAILLISLIFNVVILVFSSVSILVIQSLVQISVERQTYDAGITRMLGMSKVSVIFGMTVIRSLLFILPALFLGIILGYVLLQKMQISIFQDSDYTLFSWMGLINAIMLGLVVPLLSSINPLIQSMKHNLSESLDSNRSHVKAIFIEVLNAAQQRKAKILPYLIFGIMVLISGLSVYYLMPLALISYNLGLLLNIFFLILSSMFQGLIMIAQNLQRYCERILTFILFRTFLIMEPKSVESLVSNNLKAHQLRNKQTSFIYAMAVGFMIFLLVEYKLIIMQSDLDRIQKSGVYPYVSTAYQYALRPENIDGLLRERSDKIQGFSWITHEQRRIQVSNVKSIRAQDLSTIMSTSNIRLYGVTPYMFSTVSGGDAEQFLTIHHQSYGYDRIAEIFYSRAGSQGLGISRYTKGQLILFAQLLRGQQLWCEPNL